MLTGFQREFWVWDHITKSPEVLLSSDRHSAYFYIDPINESTGTAGVRGTKGFTEGEHYWEVVFLEPPCGTSVMIGVGTENVALHRSNFEYIDLIGFDKESWGLSYKGTAWHGGQKVQYCEPFFDKTTVIGCHLNLYKGTLAFSVNGTYMGVAFTGVNSVSGPLYPIVSSTASETELGLGEQYCRYLTLQEKCLQTIKRHLEYDDSVDCLPLPKVFKSSIKNI